MIYSLDIVDPTRAYLPYLAKIPAFSAPRKFEFKPGLNVLWGRNGTGKSTVLKILAQLLHCEQGGKTYLSETSIRNIMDHLRHVDDRGVDRGRALRETFAATAIVHDGQSTRFFDPSRAVGLDSGSFDYDFGREGVENACFKGSTGQTNMFRFESILRDLVDQTVPPAQQNGSLDYVNDYWKERVDVANEILKASGPKGQPTVLLDEPDRSLDLPTKLRLWRFIRSVGCDTQFIVAAHSLFALNLPEANYIELDPGYVELCQRGIESLSRFASEPPGPRPRPVKSKTKAKK